jgi:hypothetical protein
MAGQLSNGLLLLSQIKRTGSNHEDPPKTKKIIIFSKLWPWWGT